jgi:hypothetical protein
VVVISIGGYFLPGFTFQIGDKFRH